MPWANGRRVPRAAADADFELIAESIPQIVWTAGGDGATDYFNRRGTDFTGLPREANSGWNWLALIHPDDVERVERAWRDAVQRNSGYEIEYRLRRHDGAFRWQSCSALPVANADGEVVKWIGTLTDIDDQHQLEERLRAAERQTSESLLLLETLQSAAPVGFGFVDREFRIVRINEALAATTGQTPEQQVGRTLEELIPELWPELGPVYRRALETGEAVVNRETSAELPGDRGRVRTWLTSFYPVRLEDEVIGIGVIVVDITQRKAMELRLKHLSEHDSLTPLYNRRKLFVELERVLRYADRYLHAGAVLMIDIDNFKWVNDSNGHAVGDQTLKSVASVLAGRLRGTDIVGRVGGDEFAVILPEATEEQALVVASDLRFLLCERSIGPPVYVSVGIALFGPGEKLSADDLLVAADLAMYQVKQEGGDGAAVFNGHSGGLLSRVKDLRNALDAGRFILHAQPIVRVSDGRVACCELLIRMVTASGEIIAPGEFLPIAERFSLVGELDRWVIGEAAAIARREPVTINLSGLSVGNPLILQRVQQVIAAGVDPSNLTFEITETAVMGDFDKALAFVLELKKLGCDLALDDFGTGFGSFTSLKHFPARYVKIDMEFVRDINTDPTNKEIVGSIVDIAHTLGKETIAEGVENAEVLETLRGLRVDYAQGFYLGFPGPVTQPRALARAAG